VLPSGRTVHDHDDRGGEDAVPRGASSSPPRSRRVRGRSRRRRLTLGQELLLLTGVALVLAVVVKSLFFQAFYIPSGSMNDTLVLDDRILVQKVSYWGSGSPQRGDVVVFADPGGWLEEAAPPARSPVAEALETVGLFPSGGHLVKRVVAVGGDTVKCCADDGRLTVNGVPLDEEDYLADGEEPSLMPFEQEVSEGHLWVMGDNRSHSADSRAHLGDPGGGMVPEEDVVGKVLAVVWPLRNAKMLTRPETFEAVGR
jgi:signal peptidase I